MGQKMQQTAAAWILMVEEKLLREQGMTRFMGQHRRKGVVRVFAALDLACAWRATGR